MNHVRDRGGERFSDEERALLAPFVTDLDSSIFGLRNLPEVVKGALFSRYSRTDKSLRRILLDEFIQAPESGFVELVGGTAENTSNQLIATQQAEAFYARVLIGYGDDSVAELGGAHVALEGVSNIAAKALEDSRIGLSPLEKSTRYVAFNRKVDGRYCYHRPVELGAADTRRFEAAMDDLFDTYAALVEPTAAAVRARTPRDAQTTERAYASATRAKALDLLRGLLPMATYTNLGLFGNGRAFEYLLTKLYAADQSELRELAVQLQHALDALIPSFVKRAKNERGAAYQAYLRGSRKRVKQIVDDMPIADVSNNLASTCTLQSYDYDAEQRVVAAILYTHSDAALEDLRQAVDAMTADERREIVRAYVGERVNRFHRPGRALEEARYSFDILADLGAYRDLQRHRMLSQERQSYTFAHGYITPNELVEAGLADEYRRAIDHATEAFAAIESDFPDAAQYVVPLACRVRWRVTMNLRELYHFAELRSSPQGHPTYRAIAQDMYRLVAAIHPSLTDHMRYVDMNDYALERLDAERRLDAKLGVRG